MIDIIITSYGEVNAARKAINSFLNEKIPKPFKIIVADPGFEVEEMVINEFSDVKEVEYFEDPGEGKSKALNLILKKIYSKNKDDIIILSDGDVYIGEGSVKAILDEFKDEKVGMVCGKVNALDSKEEMYGYWAHLSFDAMNKSRAKLNSRREFFEVSGYLFGMRNGIIKEFPTGASEDNVLSALFWNEGYKIKYNENAEVFVKNPGNFRDWVLQKKRNVKGDLALRDVVDAKIYRNTMIGDAVRGISVGLVYPRNLKELMWTFNLSFARVYLWLSAMYDAKIKGDKYRDGWRIEETKSTRTLD